MPSASTAALGATALANGGAAGVQNPVGVVRRGRHRAEQRRHHPDRRRSDDPSKHDPHLTPIRLRACGAALYPTSNCAEQSVGDACDGGIHPARAAREHEPPHLLRLTADGNDLHAVRNRAEDDRCDGGDREPGGDDLQLGEPVAHDVANVRPLTKPWPHAKQRVAGVGPARDPHLTLELVDLDGARGGERMAGRHADDELTLGHGGELKWWRLGVRRAKRRLQGDEREVKRAGSQRSGERRRGRLPQRDLEMRRKGRQRVRHESGGRGGERAEAHWPGDGLGLPRQLTAGDVQLIEDTDGCAEQARPRRRQRHAGAAAIKEPSARGRLKRRDLPRDRGLRVSERLGGGRERPRLGDLPEDPQPSWREVRGHASYAYYVCLILV